MKQIIEKITGVDLPSGYTISIFLKVILENPDERQEDALSLIEKANYYGRWKLSEIEVENWCVKAKYGETKNDANIRDFTDTIECLRNKGWLFDYPAILEEIKKSNESLIDSCEDELALIE